MSSGMKLVLAVALSAGLIYVLMSLGDYREYLHPIANGHYSKLWPLIVIVPVIQSLRTYRINAMLTQSPPILDAQMYRISSFHMMFSALLPIRTGELALPMFLKNTREVSLARGTGILLVVRFADLLCVLILCGLCGVFYVKDQFVVRSLMIALLTSLLLVLILPAISRRIVEYCKVRSLGNGRLVKLIREMTRVLENLGTNKQWARVIVATMSVWLLMFYSFYLSSEVVVEKIQYSLVVLAGGAASLAVAQPVNGVAGIGVVQAAWAWPAQALGMSWIDAVASGILIHVVQIVSILVNAIFAQLLVQYLRRK